MALIVIELEKQTSIPQISDGRKAKLMVVAQKHEQTITLHLAVAQRWKGQVVGDEEIPHVLAEKE